MYKVVKKVIRIRKYEHFGKVLSEFYGGSEWGIMKKVGLVWVKIGKKRVVFDLYFKTNYWKRNWGGHNFMVYEMKFIRIVKIGKVDLKYDWVVENVCLPVNGYVHEESPLYQFLDNLRDMVKRFGINKSKS